MSSLIAGEPEKKTEEDDLLNQMDNEDEKQQASKKRKALGIPEMDPDALPSTLVTAYLSFGGKPKHDHHSLWLLFSLHNLSYSVCFS